MSELIKTIYSDAFEWEDTGAKLIHPNNFEKMAAHYYTPTPLVDKMSKLRPRPEGVYVLLNALGAYEYWGVNRNGDAFPEWSLKGEAPSDTVQKIISTKVKSDVQTPIPPVGSYGHETFVSNAHVFYLHDNKDPNKSIGDVIASAYNDKMHRVELIVFVYEARAPDTVRELRDGEAVPWSMGSRLPYDTCSLCFNCAKNRGQYCDHLKFQMNQVLPDGRKVFAYNWFPKFFDISRVRVPADKSAWTIRKIAKSENCGPPQKLTKEFTVDQLYKIATMDKETEGVASENLGDTPINPKLLSFINDRLPACDSADLIDENISDYLKQTKDLKGFLGAAALSGMVLRPDELSSAMGLSDQELPQNLGIDDPTIKLITVMRRSIPSRSLINPHFSERGVTKQASGKKVSSYYKQYLKLLQKEASSIIPAARSVRVLLAQNQDVLSEVLFKTSSSVIKEDRDWLPFLVKITSY